MKIISSSIIFLVVVALIASFVLVFRSKKETPPQDTAQFLQNSANRPSCPSPFIFPLPVDITKVTSILYPGQVRGGDFKAHGGFRFDQSLPTDITVTAPITAQLVSGARYPTNTGDIQYTLEFEHPCGIRYRLGHLLTLAPKFQEIANRFPLPKTLDSRTTQVYPPIDVNQGEIVATAVGMTKDGNSKDNTNTFLDWGVYDYRQKNVASQDPAWAASHTSDTYQHAVCWFDWISKEDRQKILSLPSSDTEHGKSSAYCK